MVKTVGSVCSTEAGATETPITRERDSPIAAILKVFAATKRNTNASTSQRGASSITLAARPRPVVQPICARLRNARHGGQELLGRGHGAFPVLRRECTELSVTENSREDRRR